MRTTTALVVAVVLLASLPFAYPGTTGKISGIVRETQTGEPLPGVNVVVQGTTLGAATDVQGRYFILNVPPGTYQLRASMMGYTTSVVENVRVKTDLTTEVNFQLSPTVLDLGQTVTVVAERPLIQRDATASAAVVTADEIASAPIETFQQMVETKAGVSVDRDGAIHIRGGRADEIAYLVDGVANVNPFDNTLGLQVATNAIEELSIISGSFNAEYGQALSGVINIQTKEGRQNYTGALSFQSGDILTDYAIEYNRQIRDHYAYRPLNTKELELSFGGPVPGAGRKLSFFLSGRYLDDDGYLYGIRLHSPTDFADSIRTGDGKIVAMNPALRRNLQGKLSYFMSPGLKLEYTGLYQHDHWRNYDHARKFIVEGQLQHFERGERHSLKLTHQLSSRTFYTVVGSYFWNRYWYYAYEDPRDPRYVWSGYYKEDSNYEFYTGGTVNSRLVQNAITLSGKFDLTAQLGSAHEVKAGLEVRRHDLYQHDYDVLVDQRAEPFVDQNGDGVYTPGEPFTDINLDGDWTDAGDDNGNGIRGDIIDAAGRFNNKYHHFPLELAAYVQDKIELADMVLNVGLRFDYFDPAADYLAGWVVQGQPILKPASVKTQLSPRFSLAHPITDKGKLFFSYGHFFQIPPYFRLYHNPDFEVKPGVIETDIGNADLKPQKTVSYELGFEQQLAEDVAVYVKAYFRDIRNLLGQRIYRFASGDAYAFYINRDFGHVKGVTLTLDKRFSNFFSASVDYTYQVAEGNESDPTRTRRDYRLSIEPLKQVVYLDWDQPHTLRINGNIARPRNWGVNVIGRFESGYPYTPKGANEIVRVATENSGRKIPIVKFDLHAYKTFPLRVSATRLYLTLYVKAYNLLDRKNENIVWDSTGRTGYGLARYGGVMTDAWENRPHWYSKPRELFMGVAMEF
ncbi:MAG: TonB-dependent receptor [candidate division KSB1 bacterium]|nr:TonB-dependent receptor [candidate division KSB1 bacterium]